MNFEQYRVWFLANCVSKELQQEILDASPSLCDAESELNDIIQAAHEKHLKLEQYYNTGKWE